MEYAMAQTSLAHTFGNITSFMTEFVRSLFTPNYFKTIHISSTIAYKQFNIFQNSNKEFIKKNKPILIIKPRIELDDSDTFLYGTYLTTRITDNFMDIDFSNLQPFIEDRTKGVYIKYLLNRIKMYFDVTIITDTQIQQLNQANYLKNRIRQDKPFFLETCLESYIPRGLMELLAKDIGIDLYTIDGSIKTFLDYMNGVSIFPITYKVKNASANDEFFRFYPVNIDTTFSNLTIDDGNKKGMIADSYATTFTVSTEFNGAGLYYYLTQSSGIITETDLSIVDNKNQIIPMFTISNLFTEQIPTGWTLYAYPLYKVENNDQPDLMDIKQVLNKSILASIDYCLTHGIPLETILKFYVMMDNKMLNRDIGEYDIDFSTLTLITKNVNTYSTYRLIIYVNALYINTLMLDVYGFNEEK